MPHVASQPMVRSTENPERVREYLEPGEHLIGSFGIMQGPRPGTEALAVALNVPMFAFLPVGPLASVMVCLVTAAAILIAILVLRRYFLCAVTDRGVLLLDGGHVPYRWGLRSVAARGPWASITPPGDHASQVRIGDRWYWISAGELDRAHKLSAWIAEQS